MAIYHLTAKVVSRARGQSVVAAVAYRFGAVLRDERYGITHNYARRPGVDHAEIMAPPGAPAWVYDRASLWNRVEAGERRKDAQLARALEIGLPVELPHSANVALVRDYVAQEFVAKGMIADFCIRRAEPNNPHAHILLTLREATASGFGLKARQWNRKANLLDWRAAWAERANAHLARAGHAVRIDHRTLEAQQIELAPERKTGVGPGRLGERTLPSHLQERIAERQRIAQENGETIHEDPAVALRALTRQQPSFTHRDLVQFLRSRTGGAAQLDTVVAAILKSSELVALAADEGGEARFTSRDLIEAEKSLMRRTAAMVTRRGHALPASLQAPASPQQVLTEEQRRAFDYLVGVGDIKALAVVAGSAKSALLAAARGIWEAQGFRVTGTALRRASAEDLHASSGVPSKALASREQEWKEGGDTLTPNDVVVVDGSEMLDLKQLEWVLAVADKARAKIVLLGDSQQLQAMGPLSPLHSVIAAAGPREPPRPPEPAGSTATVAGTSAAEPRG